MATAETRPKAARVELKLPCRKGLRVSERAFAALCQANPELRLERSAKGELIATPPAGSDTGMRNAGLTAQPWLWNARAGLGVAFDSSAGFTLPSGAVRGPDASWIANERWAALDSKERAGFAPITPHFVAELQSTSDSSDDLRKKMREYREQGVRLGWLIDPKSGQVEIYRPDQPLEVQSRPARLNGENVLPGFVLELAGIMID